MNDLNLLWPLAYFSVSSIGEFKSINESVKKNCNTKFKETVFQEGPISTTHITSLNFKTDIRHCAINRKTSCAKS